MRIQPSLPMLPLLDGSSLIQLLDTAHGVFCDRPCTFKYKVGILATDHNSNQITSSPQTVPSSNTQK